MFAFSFVSKSLKEGRNCHMMFAVWAVGHRHLLANLTCQIAVLFNLLASRQK